MNTSPIPTRPGPTNLEQLLTYYEAAIEWQDLLIDRARDEINRLRNEVAILRSIR